MNKKFIDTYWGHAASTQCDAVPQQTPPGVLKLVRPDQPAAGHIGPVEEGGRSNHGRDPPGNRDVGEVAKQPRDPAHTYVLTDIKYRQSEYVIKHI